MGKRSINVETLPFTGKDGENGLRISVGYEEGGTNWYSGQNHTRGFYAYVTPVKEENRGGYVTVSAVLGAGLKCCLEEAGRFSAKRLEKLASICMVRPDFKRCIETVSLQYGKAE
jgi:hypothetical protein